MAYTKEQIKKIVDEMSKELTKNTGLTVNIDVFQEKMAGILSYIGTKSSMTPEAFDAGIKEKYKDMYISLFKSAMANEKANPAVKKALSSVEPKDKSPEELAQILNNMKEYELDDEIINSINSCNSKDLTTLEKKYEQHIRKENPKMDKLMKKMDDLDNKVTKLRNSNHPSEKNDAKIGEYTTESNHIYTRLNGLKGEGGISAYKDLTAIKEIIKGRRIQYLNLKDSTKEDMESKLSSCHEGFEAMMKSLWNSVIRENITDKENKAPVYGGMTEEDSLEVKNVFYKSHYMEMKEKGRVDNKGSNKYMKIVKDQLNGLKGNDEFEDPELFAKSFGIAYKLFEVNFSNRGIFSKLFHLNEYFLARSIRTTMMDMCHKGKQECISLLTETAEKSESKESEKVNNLLYRMDEARTADQDDFVEVDTKTYDMVTEKVTGAQVPFYDEIADKNDDLKEDPDMYRLIENDEREL